MHTKIHTHTHNTRTANTHTHILNTHTQFVWHTMQQADEGEADNEANKQANPKERKKKKTCSGTDAVLPRYPVKKILSITVVYQKLTIDMQ